MRCGGRSRSLATTSSHHPCRQGRNGPGQGSSATRLPGSCPPADPAPGTLGVGADRARSVRAAGDGRRRPRNLDVRVHRGLQGGVHGWSKGGPQPAGEPPVVGRRHAGVQVVLEVVARTQGEQREDHTVHGPGSGHQVGCVDPVEQVDRHRREERAGHEHGGCVDEGDGGDRERGDARDAEHDVADRLAEDPAPWRRRLPPRPLPQPHGIDGPLDDRPRNGHLCHVRLGIVRRGEPAVVGRVRGLDGVAALEDQHPEHGQPPAVRPGAHPEGAVQEVVDRGHHRREDGRQQHEGGQPPARSGGRRVGRDEQQGTQQDDAPLPRADEEQVGAQVDQPGKGRLHGDHQRCVGWTPATRSVGSMRRASSATWRVGTAGYAWCSTW